jgi:hypothetical protein
MHVKNNILNAAFIFSVIFFTGTITPIESHAQSLEEQMREQRELVHGLCKDSIKKSLSLLRPHLSKYPKLQNDKNLVIFVEWIDFNAYAQYSQQRIFITSTLCDYTFLLMRAQLLAHHYSMPAETLVEYTNYLGQKIRHGEREVKPGELFKQKINPYEVYFDLDLKKLDQRSRQIIDAVIHDEMPNFLLPVIGHELGHLIKEHKPYNAILAKTAREQEYEADQFGYDIVTKALGEAPHPAIFIASLQLFGAREKLSAASGRTTHPRPECRQIKIIHSSGILKQIENDEAMIREYENKSGVSYEKTVWAVNEGLKECAE